MAAQCAYKFKASKHMTLQCPLDRGHDGDHVFDAGAVEGEIIELRDQLAAKSEPAKKKPTRK